MRDGVICLLDSAAGVVLTVTTLPAPNLRWHTHAPTAHSSLPLRLGVGASGEIAVVSLAVVLAAAGLGPAAFTTHPE